MFLWRSVRCLQSCFHEPPALTILIKPVKFSFVYRARSCTSATRIATCSCRIPLGIGVDRKEEMNLELVPPLLNGIHTLRVRFVPSDVFIVVIRTSVAGMLMVPLDVAVVILWFGVGIVIVHEVSYFVFCFFNTPSKLRRLSFPQSVGGTHWSELVANL
jgi:hypothetical protein